MKVHWGVKMYDDDGLITDPKAYQCGPIERVQLLFSSHTHGRAIEVDLPNGTFARSDQVDSGEVVMLTEDYGWVFQEAYDAITRVKLPNGYRFDLCIAPRGFIFANVG